MRQLGRFRKPKKRKLANIGGTRQIGIFVEAWGKPQWGAFQKARKKKKTKIDEQQLRGKVLH